MQSNSTETLLANQIFKITKVSQSVKREIKKAATTNNGQLKQSLIK